MQLQKIHEDVNFQETRFLHLSVSYEFGNKCCSSWSVYGEISLFSTKNLSFLGFKCLFKQVKPKRKNFRQSWTKHLWTFSLSSTIHHQKVNVRVAPGAAVSLKTYELRKLGYLKETPEMLGFDYEYPVVHPKSEFWRFPVKNWKKKISVKHSIEKPILLSFVNSFATSCPRLSEKTD